MNDNTFAVTMSTPAALKAEAALRAELRQTKRCARRGTVRARARGKSFPGEDGVRRLAAQLGCGPVSIYDWERPGRQHLPKNRLTRAAYLAAIGLAGG